MEVERGVEVPQLPEFVDEVAKGTETKEGDVVELRSTQETTRKLHIVQPVKSVEGGVSPLKEAIGRTYQAVMPTEIINLSSALTKKTSKILRIQSL